MLRAARFSWRAGRPLNRYVVLHLPPGAAGDEFAPKRAFQDIRRRCRSWWDYRREKSPALGPLTDMVTWENVSGVLHVNWLLHIPPQLVTPFDRMLGQRVSKVLKDGRAPGDLDIGAIYNLNGLLPYILKGTEKESAHVFGIDPKDQGEIYGRRAFASRNLGRAARDRAWQEGTVVNRSWRHRRPSPYA